MDLNIKLQEAYKLLADMEQTIEESKSAFLMSVENQKKAIRVQRSNIKAYEKLVSMAKEIESK